MKLAPYVAATALAEGVAQVLSAIVAELSAEMAMRTPSGAVYLLPASLILAGALEGAMIGAAQAHVLRDVVPPRAFVGATTLAMTASWVAGAVVSLVEPASAPGPVLVLGVAAVLGAVVGFALGLAQDRVLARAGVSGTRFIGYSALGWCAAQVVLAMLAGLADMELSAKHLALRFFAGLLGGAVAGLVAGPPLVDAVRAVDTDAP